MTATTRPMAHLHVSIGRHQGVQYVGDGGVRGLLLQQHTSRLLLLLAKEGPCCCCCWVWQLHDMPASPHLTRP